MSEKRPFDFFIDLISFDQKLCVHELNIEKHKQEIAQHEEQKRALDAQLQHAKTVLHDARKEVDEKELQMKELEAQEADKKRRMDQVANQKEYQSLKHEIEMIGTQQLALEDVLVSAWNQLEIAQKKLEVSAKEHGQKIESVNAEIEKKQQELEELTSRLEEQKKLRSTKEETVPEEWLEKYMIMRARVSDPVVPVVDGSCSSCFHQMTGQDFMHINRNKLMQCKGCYRFLYNETLDQQVES